MSRIGVQDVKYYRVWPIGLEELEKTGLTKGQSEIYRMVVLEGVKVSEAARTLEVSPAMVSKTLKRAVSKVERYMAVKKDALQELRGELEMIKWAIVALLFEVYGGELKKTDRALYMNIRKTLAEIFSRRFQDLDR